MSIIRSLFGETRSLTPNQAWLRGMEFGSRTDAGVAVTQDNALALSTVYACVTLIADTISTLPVDVYYRADGERRPFRPKPAWVTEWLPGIAGSRIAGVGQVVTSLLLDGNAFVLVLGDVYNPTTLEVLDPRRVIVSGTQGNPTYTVSTSEGRYAFDRTQIIHVSRTRRPGELRGLSPVEENRQALGIGMAGQKQAGRYFANGLQLSGVIKVPGEMGGEDAKALLEGFSSMHTGERAFRAGILTGGAEWQPLGVTAEQGQFLESRMFSEVAQVARMFRVPPMLIGDNTPGAVSYASSEQAAIAFEKHTIRPILEVIEAAFSPLVPTPESFLKFTTDGLLRGDPKTRYEAYETSLRSGWHSINEVRRLEDLPAIDGGDAHRVQIQLVDINAPAQSPAASQGQP